MTMQFIVCSAPHTLSTYIHTEGLTYMRTDIHPRTYHRTPFWSDFHSRFFKPNKTDTHHLSKLHHTAPSHAPNNPYTPPQTTKPHNTLTPRHPKLSDNTIRYESMTYHPAHCSTTPLYTATRHITHSDTPHHTPPVATARHNTTQQHTTTPLLIPSIQHPNRAKSSESGTYCYIL